MQSYKKMGSRLQGLKTATVVTAVALATDVAWVQLLAWKFLHAAEEKKKKVYGYTRKTITKDSGERSREEAVSRELLTVLLMHLIFYQKAFCHFCIIVKIY